VIADMLPAIGAICGSQPPIAVGATAMGATARVKDTRPIASFMTHFFLSSAPVFEANSKFARVLIGTLSQDTIKALRHRDSEH
jgi:hypothetical protein